MALFSFGKKDKNPPEVAAPVAKTPPKIQTPPGTGSVLTVKPPQPTGMMPITVMPGGTATTQPMPMPRTGMTGLKPSRPVPTASRSTQRIVLPAPPGSKTNNTKALAMGTAGGRINLPMGMILRCLPPEVLADELSKFEANGTAATEIGLPMNMILGQLPSGKVEMALQDLVPHFPAGYLQPRESIASYLPTLINLPLMDVVMRIPPDLLALRPDQKDVDAAVINMADPFTEEILREQAETARQQSEPNIIEESQAPQEEFVPRDQAETPKPSVPPRRPAVEPMIPARAATAPPMPPVAKLPTPSPMSSLRGSSPPSQPLPPLPPRNLSASGQIPTRSTAALSVRAQANPPFAPIPPVPRHTGSIPAPPPRHTTSLPVPRRTGALPTPGPATIAPQAPLSIPVEKPTVPPRGPDSGSDDLQRLAALAMTQMGDSNESADEVPPVEASQKTEPVRAPKPKIEDQPAPVIDSAPVPVPASEPPPVPSPKPPPLLPEVVSQPVPAPESLPKPSWAAAPHPVPEPEAPLPATSVAFNLNTCTVEDLVKNIPDCSREVAESIIEYRTKIGAFKRIEELLDVPGITKVAYTNLTGETPPDNRTMLSLNELLGFPAEQYVSLKDVTDRIACWPDVTGCVLSQNSGLSLVGTVPKSIDKAAIVAFAPRMFESINKSFSEVSGQETDALVIPSVGTSFHLFRNRDLYLIIMSRLPQMPERHVKIARFVLAALSPRRD